jgi:hypothetical protein
MEPSHLSLDEVKYELEIRAMTFESEKQAIRSLRARLRQEITDLTLRPNIAVHKPEEEIPTCYAKMLELLEFLVVKVCLKDPRVRAQIYSRLCHLEKRVSRIDVQEISQTEGLPTTHSVLVEKIKLIRDKYYPERPLYRPEDIRAINEEPYRVNLDDTDGSEEEDTTSADDDEISESEENVVHIVKPTHSKTILHSSTPKFTTNSTPIPSTSYYKPAYPVQMGHKV